MKQYFTTLPTNTHRRKAIITGLFFIAATVTAIAGLKLYDPILVHTDYLSNATKHATQITWGAVMELVLICANAGTAIMLFPYLKKYNVHLGLGYITFRLLEVVFILIGIIALLAVLTLGHAHANDTNPNMAAYQTAGTVAKAIHDWTFILGPLFMLGVNTSIYSYVFYKTKLVPHRLAIVGIAAAFLVFISSLLVMFGLIEMLSFIQILFALPIAIYEMVLAGWLIAKGFNISFFNNTGK